MTFSIRMFDGFIRFYCNDDSCNFNNSKEGLCKFVYDFLPKHKCPYDILKKKFEIHNRIVNLIEKNKK